MFKNKTFTGENPSPKKLKKKFDKNNSFSGVESKKSPKHRRKSIATVLSTPLKKKKRDSLNEWSVSGSVKKDISKRKLLVISDTPLEENNSDIKPSVLTTPKTENSNTLAPSSVKKKSVRKSINPASKLENVPTAVKKEKKKVQQNITDIFEVPQSSKVVDNTDKNFGIKSHDVAKAIKAVLKLHSENPKLKNQLFKDTVPLFLQVNCHKIPQGPSRIIRIPLPHSILTPDDEICLIVPEVKGIKNIEHEKHVEHYENLLRSKGVENVKKIMTFHEFRTEYETFEQKLRLVDLYDTFLVDGKISGKVVNKSGKIFYKKRKVPTSVKLRVTNLKAHIDQALSKAFFNLHLKGDSYTVQFGHDKIETQDLVDNVFAIIQDLNKEFPGGFDNIKGISVYALRATSVPIYSSFKNSAEVDTPKIIPKKPKAFKTYTDELTTIETSNAQVVVKPTGEVNVKVKKGVKENEDKGSAESKNEKETKAKESKKRKHTETISDDTAKEEKDIKVENSEIKIKKKKLEVKLEESMDSSNEKVKKNKRTSKTVMDVQPSNEKVAKKKKHRTKDDDKTIEKGLKNELKSEESEIFATKKQNKIKKIKSKHFS